MPVEQVLDVGVKLAGALETAHRSGVPHRDVEPDTITIHTRFAVTCDLSSTFPAPVSDMNVTLLFHDAGGTIIGGEVEGTDVDGVGLMVPRVVPRRWT